MDELAEGCPLCGRVLFEGSSINKHHMIPKTFGGKESVWIHKVCHGKIHSLFTERELLQYYHTGERLREHPEILKFVKWVRKKEPDFETRHEQAKRKRR